MSANLEKLVRAFVRANFSARVVKGDDGSYQSQVSKTTARVLIQNPARVLENLEELCGAGDEKGNTVTFNAKKGELKGQKITLTQSNGVNTLTVPMSAIEA